MIAFVKLNKENGDLLKNSGRVMGQLNYVFVTRPDIAFIVSVVSQFMSPRKTTH